MNQGFDDARLRLAKALRSPESASSLLAPLMTGRKPRVASFFCGAGGLDIGFHQAGYDIVFATDIVPLFCATVEANRGKYIGRSATVLCEDIRKLDENAPADIDFVIGGPPCQTFSASGRRAGGAAGRLDQRGTLFEAYCRMIAKLSPKGFLFENVRGILGTNRGKDWEEIERAFGRIGYTLHHRVLDACDYGLPQHRERVFLVGTRSKEEFLFPMPTHGPDSPNRRPHITPSEAFQALHNTEDLEELALKDGRYAHLLPAVPPGENYLFFTAKRGHPAPVFAYRSRFSDFLYKADPSKPIKTLIASPGKYTGPFHWDNRSFSIAEYRRLQGFPDAYAILGSRTDVIRQIGNSVSPVIAEAMAGAIADQLFSRRSGATLMPGDAKFSFDGRKGRQAQATRSRHLRLESVTTPRNAPLFLFRKYAARVGPTTLRESADNVVIRVPKERAAVMTVRADSARKLFAKMTLVIGDRVDAPALFSDGNGDFVLEVALFGESDFAVQTMWNAIDDFVIRCSSFHSLFELYGHFTEPHPIFKITRFTRNSDHPITQFAEHISDFSNCSRYFKKESLVGLFGPTFGTREFTKIASILRGYRFDIRSHETNIAIPPDVYMVTYPFTLPMRKQMNFSLKNRDPKLTIPGELRNAKA